MDPTYTGPFCGTIQLPQIDLANPDLVPGTPTWDLVRRDVFKAFEEFGCFEAVHETLVPSELHDRLLMKDGLIEQLFSLPSETKERLVDPERPFNGYIRGLPTYRIFEAMGISGALERSKIKNLMDLFYPEGNSLLCESLFTYAKKLAEMDQMVKRMVFEELGVEKYLQPHLDSIDYSVRINKYAAPNTEKEQPGTGAHTDKNFMTILQQNHIDGLRVKTKDGEWFKVSPSSPSSYIIMVGDSFLGWTNGRIYCPMHGVMLSGTETRYSIGLFTCSKGTVRCPEELVDEQHPMLFKPFDEISLIKFQRTEEGRRAESTLKAYFSVVV